MANQLKESALPVELQAKNVISPAYIISPSMNGEVKTVSGGTVGTNAAAKDQPCVVISEQPQQRGFRFRYECEGPSHGGLQGTKSERSKKSYPAIKIENYTGAARVVVSLVTDEKSPRAHAHKLVGTNCKDGLCTVEIKANTDPIIFPNLCILHVTRKKLIDVLTGRILDAIKLNKKLKENNMNFEPPITDEDRRLARSQADEQSKNMQLNVVRLCFQVFLRNPDGSFSKMLTPVASQPIYDSKSPGASALKICRMDKYGGCCSGNEEVFLLCEKVQKDDIQVRFVEQAPDGSVRWEAYGNFGPLDVHRQYAIVFKTPAYYNTNIDKAVNVLIMLQRKSDQEVSEPKAFTYFPQNRDKDNIASKKRKRIPLDGYDFGDGGMGGSGMGGDGGGGGDEGGTGPGSGPGGGGGGVIVGGLTSNGTIHPGSNIMMHQSNTEADSDKSHIPHSVKEAMAEELEKKRQALDKERLKNSSKFLWEYSPQDQFFGCEDSDIEVDAAVVPFSPTTQSKSVSRDDPLSVLNVDSKDAGDKSERTRDQDKPCCGDKKLPSNSSYEQMDSGLVSGVSECITSIDEKHLTKPTTPCVPKSSSSPSVDFHKETTDCDKKVSNSSSASDYHSEPDTKVDIISEGVKSDEGFSDTSDDAMFKSLLNSRRVKQDTIHGHTTCTETFGPYSKLTDTVRQVAGRVTERTLAALVDYAETGDIRHLLLVQRHLLAISNEDGDLPLHLAVINSQPDALKSLLEVMITLPQSSRQVNSFNLLRQTPAHLATVMQQHPMVEMLLHAGADPTLADRNGNTPAHLAVINLSHQCLQSLVKYLRPDATLWNPFPELNYLNYDGYSPIHLASQLGDVSMLRTLVFGKADADLPDGKSGKTALHHAVDNDDLPVAGYLLMEAHVNVNARCFDGNTALHVACARQLVGMVALLVAAGADVEIENEEIPESDVNADDSGSRDRRGLRPVDYADDNDQITQILYQMSSLGLDESCGEVMKKLDISENLSNLHVESVMKGRSWQYQHIHGETVTN
ncbi:nuclear factor NF-kappa-B p105 subunit isoform X2 [Aplysia californica]|uniref:Nuclear factor NF-kappa-B p105 subunit isoform X2 n=1 Tax=Aplysia californica TaxID=6500 RepID=A0ABM0JD83_APLCA|nr:nuclear factor NF-kappa-B p105 subunit isoform X2 [Aplysia californica]